MPLPLRLATRSGVRSSAHRQLGQHIVIDHEGLVVVADGTNSPDFPTTPDAFDRQHAGALEAYVARLRLDGSIPPEQQLVYSTFLGGTGADAVRGLALDPQEGVWLLGWTFEGPTEFPTTPDAYSRARRGGVDGFLTHFKLGGASPQQQLLYSTFFGGADQTGSAQFDRPSCLAVSPSGAVTFAGQTPSADFPTTCGALSAQFNGGLDDLFLARLDPSREPAEQLVYSTLLGGSLQDTCDALAVDAIGRVVFAGSPQSASFPDLPELMGHGSHDVFVGRLDLRLPRAAFTIRTKSFEAGTLEVEVNAATSQSPEGTGITRFEWDFGDGELGAGILATHTYAQPGHYRVRLKVTNDIGHCDATTHPLLFPCEPGDIDSWSETDIGAPTFPGGASLAEAGHDQCFEVCAGGRLLAGTSDELHFVYREIEGDAFLTAQVLRAAGASGWQLGLMARESLHAGAPHAAIVVQGGAGNTVRYRGLSRSAANGDTAGKTGKSSALPAWVRLERRSGEVIGSSSSDGAAWEELTRISLVSAQGRLLVGIAAAANESESFQALTGRLCVQLGLPGLGPFLRGDCNGDCKAAGNVTDAVFLLSFSFRGGSEPGCKAACDSNGDGKLDLSDAVYLLGHNFLGRPAPPPPFPQCGTSVSAEDDALGCPVPLAPCE